MDLVEDVEATLLDVKSGLEAVDFGGSTVPVTEPCCDATFVFFPMDGSEMSF